ncbi:MAG: aminoglycoside phosphotransferase family protein [Cyanobacteria bacterium P01_E01_bin.35]
MNFTLSFQNVIEYLAELNLCHKEDRANSQIEQKSAKNFNLLVSLPDGRKLLVKQERFNQQGETAGEFFGEWRIQELTRQFSELGFFKPWLPEMLHFDVQNSILVCNYLDDYCDLSHFYRDEKIYPGSIASAIGGILAQFHRLTLDRQDFQDSLFQVHKNLSNKKVTNYSVFNLTRRLERIKPEIFGQVPQDALRFYKLYQRYDSLGQAISEITNAYEPCCLIHNDLKINNILLSLNWSQEVTSSSAFNNGVVRLIDWERCTWGDPALDIGKIIASYLGIWLCSFMSNKNLTIEESLSLAEVPLATLQPSIVALTQAYLAAFPEILERHPDYLSRVIQYAGLGLIQSIQAMLQKHKCFGNRGICLLQVAKTLLCHPEKSIPTVFGMEASQLIDTLTPAKM